MAISVSALHVRLLTNKSYPCIGTDKPRGLQEGDARRILRQSAGLSVSRTGRLYPKEDA